MIQYNVHTYCIQCVQYTQYTIHFAILTSSLSRSPNPMLSTGMTYNDTVRTVQTVHTILSYSYLFAEEVPELNALDREVDNGGVLLHKKRVLLEPLDVQDDKP